MSAPAAAPRVLRRYQAAAVAAAVSALADRDAGQVHMACGSGKTLVALRIAEQTAPDSALLVVLTPTIALVAQLLAEWRADAVAQFTALAVCSDDTVTDAPIHTGDIEARVSTDSVEVRAWITRTAGRRCVFGTYASAHVIAEALRATGTGADFLLCDEAHHLTGRADAATRRVLDRTWLPARRRLFATATPRFDLRISGEVELIGMDDAEVFGPVLADYPLSQAITEGWLKDYRVAVIGVTRAEALALLVDQSVDFLDSAGGESLRTLATQIAMAKARCLYGIRRAITFHYRIEDAQAFARTLPATIARLPHADQPGGALLARHVHGEMTHHQRHLVLDHLRQPPPQGWTVIANSRCLGEGVDIPAVDAIGFGHPKKAPTDIIQAIGRAVRRHDDTNDIATIVVPIVVPDTGEEVQTLDPAEYTVLWNILAALRAHDEPLGASLDYQRSHATTTNPQLPEKISIVLPPGTADHVLAELTLLLVRQSTSPWWDGYGAARRYADQFGNLLVPQTYRDPGTGYRLGTWINAQRRRVAQLPADRRRLLNELGMVWNALDASWEQWLFLAEKYRADNGHVRIPKDCIADGKALGSWWFSQKRMRARGRLSPDRAARLETLGIAWTDFEAGLAACDRYIAAFGDLDVPRFHLDEEKFPLGTWIQSQRARNAGTGGSRLTAHERAALETRGMLWRKAAQGRALTSQETTALLIAREKGRNHPDVNRAIRCLVDAGVQQAAIADTLGVSRGAINTRLKRSRG